MSRTDFYHNHVRDALIKAGWIITDDQLSIRFDTLRLSIDLMATKTAADGSVSYIAVEVKNFRERKDYVNEFHKAVGQFLAYRELLKLRDFPHTIYLAVPDAVFKTFFQSGLIRHLTKLHALQFITFDPELQTLVQWNP